jgi:membrane protein DedA with SNARE-associated domain
VLISLLFILPACFVVASYLEDLVETGGQEGSTLIVALITSLPTNVIHLAAGAGYAGIFLLMLLESAAFPVPSEVILPLAGYLVFKGVLQYWPVVFYSTVAALLGSFVDYYLGMKLGAPLFTGQTKLPYVRVEHLRRIQAWFTVYGPAAVALLRLVPTARVLISFPAGAGRMNPFKFALCTILGCLPWNILLVYVGWWLGASWEKATSFFRYINLLVYLVMILFACWIVWRLAMGRRK